MRRLKNPKSTGFYFTVPHQSPRTIEDNVVRYFGVLSWAPCRNVLCQGCWIVNAKCVLEHCLFYNHGCVVEVSFFWFRIAAGADCVCFWTRWVSAVIDICVKSRHTLHINSACSQWSWCAILYRIFYKNCAHCRLLLLCSLCTHNFTFLVVQLNLLTKVFEANSKIIFFTIFGEHRKHGHLGAWKNEALSFLVVSRLSKVCMYWPIMLWFTYKNRPLLELIVIHTLIVHTVLRSLSFCLIPEAA